jgi:ACS family hexuronate transporter-like MFS transporter
MQSKVRPPMLNKTIGYEKRESYQWVILALITAAHVTNIYSVRSVVPLNPFLQSHFDLNHFQIGLMTSSFFMGSFLFSIPMGWLVDRIGVYWAMPLGQCIVGIFILSLCFANSYAMVCGALFLAGTGYAAINPATAKVVMHWFPTKRRASAMGFKQTGVPAGGALAAATLPALALSFGWRYSFAFAGMVTISSVVFCLIFYKRPYRNENDENTKPDGHSVTILDILKNRDLMLLSFLMAFFIGLQSTLETYLVLFCIDTLFYSVITAGFFLALAHTGGILGRLSWGPVSDFLFGARRKNVLMIIGSISSVMCLTFVFLTPNFPSWIVGVMAVIFGVCAIGWNGIFLILAAELSGKGREGMALGISLTIVFIGQIVGPPVFGFVVDKTGSYDYAWLLFCILLVLATSLIALVREPKKNL